VLFRSRGLLRTSHRSPEPFAPPGGVRRGRRLERSMTRTVAFAVGDGPLVVICAHRVPTMIGSAGQGPWRSRPPARSGRATAVVGRSPSGGMGTSSDSRLPGTRSDSRRLDGARTRGSVLPWRQTCRRANGVDAAGRACSGGERAPGRKVYGQRLSVRDRILDFRISIW